MVARGHGSIIYIVLVLVRGIPDAIIGAGNSNAEPLLRNLAPCRSSSAWPPAQPSA